MIKQRILEQKTNSKDKNFISLNSKIFLYILNTIESNKNE